MENHLYPLISPDEKDLGPDSAGQSGDTQGLSNLTESSSASVVELIQEGQFTEAGILDGIENSEGELTSEVHTKQFPVDDVPPEYRDEE